MNEDSGSKKIIGIKQFRHLVDSFVQTEVQQPNSNLEIFESDSTAQIVEEVKQPSTIVRISQYLREAKLGSGVFSFILEFYNYLYARLRVIFILISVTLEIINNIFDGFKRLIIRNLFWGRGYLFRYSFQLVLGILVIIMLLSANYRESWEQKGVGVAGRPVLASDLPDTTKADLLVQNATTKTVQPKDRQRQNIDKYIVKDGDSLSQIAQFYNLKVETLMWANNLSAAHLVTPGQELIVPPGDGIIAVIKDDDTLDSLASRYSSNTQLIADANLLDPPFNLVAGTEIFVPDGRPPVPLPSSFTFSGVIQSAPAPNWASSFVDPSVGRFLGWPVEGGRGMVTQCPSSWHNAIDVADGGMPTLVATSDGVINFAGCHSGSCPAPGDMIGGSGAAWGVELDHGNGYTSLYAHLYKIYVTTGQTVKAGDPIGQMGMTGAATGIHVHYELWAGRKWNRVDPAAYMTTHICGF